MIKYHFLRGSTVGALQDNNQRPRDVAQLGSAPRLGRGGRTFKSCHPDHFNKRLSEFLKVFFNANYYSNIKLTDSVSSTE